MWATQIPRPVSRAFLSDQVRPPSLHRDRRWDTRVGTILRGLERGCFRATKGVRSVLRTDPDGVSIEEGRT
jgi:hypothetical protein